MILKSLELTNFRVYKGKEIIEFSSGEKNITIIQGNNEVGKTTIMNAISWCLYKEEFYKNEGKKPIWNLSAGDDLAIGESDNVIVTLNMEDDNKKIVFSRVLKFSKSDKGKVIGGGSNLKITEDDGKNTKQYLDTDTYLNKHLPKKLRKYFLFDGEQLENYFDLDNKNKNIKDSVDRLSQLNLLKRVNLHIGNIEDKYLEQQEELSPMLTQIQKEIKDKEESLKSKTEDLEQLNSELEIHAIKIKEYEDQIREIGVDPQELMDDREEYDNALNDTIEEIKKNKKDREKYLVDEFLYIFGYEALNKFQDIGEELRVNNFIPADYKKRFLKEILDKNICICGNHLDEGTHSREVIEQLFDDTNPVTDIEEYVNELLGSTGSYIEEYPKDFIEKLVGYDNDKNKLNNDKDNYESKIQKIDNKLENIGIEEVEEIQEKLESRRISEKNGFVKKGSLENSIKSINSKLKKLYSDEKKEKQKRDKLSEVEKNLEFIQRVKETSSKLEKEISESIHSKLQKSTAEQFKNMHWKDVYDTVKIDKNNYHVTIYQKDGEELIAQDLSKGGQLTLALAFMISLNSLSGFDLPIFIDTPMGRLDTDIKMNIAKFLPTSAKDKQITLLVTGTEYDDEFRSEIYDHVGKEYKISFNGENKGISKVVQWD